MDVKIIPSAYSIIYEDGEEFEMIKCPQPDGKALYKILQEGYTLSIDLTWEYECCPSNRTDAYLYRNRHGFEKAIKLLEEWKNKNG
jgi:hypothetical protein